MIGAAFVPEPSPVPARFNSTSAPGFAGPGGIKEALVGYNARPSSCEHRWYLDLAFTQQSMTCTRCPARVDDIPWDVDPFDYAASRYPSPTARRARRRVLRPARVTP